MSEEKIERKPITDYVEAVIDSSFHKILGKALDFGRMSGMSDRSFTQFTRAMKDFVNELENVVVKDFKSKGIIKE